MRHTANALRWQGEPGHYEVYYLTATERESGVGIWIRYTMVSPLTRTGEPPTCALWFVAMDPRGGVDAPIARKATFAIDCMRGSSDPFELRIDEALLSDERMSGGFEDVAWDLRWTPGARAYEHVHPALARLGMAKTVLVLPHADVSIDGSVTIAGERLEAVSDSRCAGPPLGLKARRLLGLGPLQRPPHRQRRTGPGHVRRRPRLLLQQRDCDDAAAPV